MIRNWKTTICGLAFAVVEAIDSHNGHNWHGYVLAALVAGLGFLAKDQSNG